MSFNDVAALGINPLKKRDTVRLCRNHRLEYGTNPDIGRAMRSWFPRWPQVVLAEGPAPEKVAIIARWPSRLPRV